MDFLKNIFLKNKPESSKRFFGGLGIVASIIVICVYKQDLVSELLYTSAALLGLGLLEKIK